MRKDLVLSIAAILSASIGTPGTSAWAGESWSDTNGKAAVLVLGQEDFNSGDANRGGVASAKTLSSPNDVAIDRTTGKVFVCDGANNRVLRYASAAALSDGVEAEAVLGQPDLDTTAGVTTRAGMKIPGAIAVDGAGRLWVADSLNHRVLRFDGAAAKASGANADGVLGQINFTAGSPALSQTRMNLPFGIAVDGAGHLWVSDRFNNRVLRFDAAAAKANGAGADGVLGQADFLSDDIGPREGLTDPSGIAVDDEGDLWVADSSNHRVLLYHDADTRSGRFLADLLLGQTSFLDNSSGLSATKFDTPTGVAVDPEGRLWVSEPTNNRILRFDNARQKVLGDGADGVLGQDDFGTNSPSTKRNRIHSPFGLSADEVGNLWVADQANNRVLRFELDRFQPDCLVGKSPVRQAGDGRYNLSGAGQSITVKMRGRRKGRAFFTIENDGNTNDDLAMIATKGNRKLKVSYLAGGNNVTAQLTRGVDVNMIPGTKVIFESVIRSTRKSRGKRAGRALSFRASSTADGERDTVKAKVQKTP